ncbi:MAG: hypothetical protein QM299_13715 [Pseudomonadota bacterium]|uniref:Uncharacterized protein n=1 Tax=anaerobic digester metagenome TaxID=1263854 RepID=A0A485LXC7_9ZZZZ|nr:hypothetical protein [Pseudomonadota bacterium]HPX17257.1 hypothetical protein [Deltaproteobacteria bacterium]
MPTSRNGCLEAMPQQLKPTQSPREEGGLQGLWSEPYSPFCEYI